MVGKENLRTEDLDLCFEKLMIVAGGGVSGNSGKGVKMEGGVISEWKDIPVELLMQILALVDDQTVISASGVCRGWRDAICFGLTRLSLSWCSKNMNNLVLSLAPKFTKLQTLILRQSTPQLEDNAVETIANCCNDLQILDLSKSFKLTDRSLKLKMLNLCGCVKAASDTALQAIGRYCNQLQSLNLGWCENVGDIGVMSLAHGCPDLRTLDLCGCVCITDESVIALANRCPHLRSLGLYYCQNLTDRAMYSLAHSKVNHRMWGSVKGGGNEEDGLRTLNISQCTALTPSAVQAVCDSFPALHTCSGRHSLITSGCLNLTSVHCACAVLAHRAVTTLPHPAH